MLDNIFIQFGAKLYRQVAWTLWALIVPPWLPIYSCVVLIHPSELQLNKSNTSATKAAFLNLHLSISNDIVSTKIYYKRYDFDFEIANSLFLDGDVPRSTSYGVDISQLIRFARASGHAADFNTRYKLRNFLNKAISIINFTKPFLNFIDETMIWYLNSKLDLRQGLFGT